MPPGGHNKGHRKLQFDRVVEALRLSSGIRANAAARLKCDRTTLCDFMRENPELIEIANQIDSEFCDLVEDKLFNLIHKGDTRSVHFYLSTKGKTRGYNTRVEQTGPDGGPLQHAIVEDQSASAALQLIEKLAGERAPAVPALPVPNGHAKPNGGG